MKKKKLTQADLIPPDHARCQAEERPGGPYSFMTIGPIPKMERCTAKPVCIATELKPGKDGLKGSMSLCGRHLAVLFEERGPHFSIVEINATKPIQVSEFGRDHWSLLAYIETLCVEGDGSPDLDRMRCNVTRHPGLVGPRSAKSDDVHWRPRWATRLKGHAEHAPRQAVGHDDHDCADDLKAAGFIKVLGTGIAPRYELTQVGAAVAQAIRLHKQSGGTFSNFAHDEPARDRDFWKKRARAT